MKPILLIVAVALAGCAAPRQPTNPSNPSANFAADRWACQQAVAALPPVAAPAVSRQLQPTEAVTNCQRDLMGGAECQTKVVAPTPSATDAFHDTMAKLQVQRAQNEREGAWRNCMMAKGWQ